MKLTGFLRRSAADQFGTFGFDQLFEMFKFNGNAYPLGFQQTLTGAREHIGDGFESYVRGAYKRNGVIFACMVARMMLFSEARFQFQNMTGGRPGSLFGTNALSILERPWPGATTGDLLTRMIQDADLAGGFYGAVKGDRIKRLRPDWVAIVMGTDASDTEAIVESDIDAELVGYVYQPGGFGSKHALQTLDVDEVIAFSPLPDPIARYRGMSWLTPVIREIMGDSAATEHKLKFFENGATPNMVVKLPNIIEKDAFKAFMEQFDSQHQGVKDAYRTLFVAGGADVEVVGKDFQQLDFKLTQGAGETRICMAARVPPVIVGASEGLQAATYSNYGQARRHFGDSELRPLWRNAAGSVERVVPAPAGARLWYDDRDIPFLQEDQKDAAEILSLKASAIQTLVNSGFDAKTVTAAVDANDITLLKHTDLVSVQLQPPGTPSKGGADQAISDAVAKALAAQKKPEQKAIEVHPHVEVHTGDVRPEIHVEAPEAPDVRVDVAPAEIRFEMPEVEPPVVTVTVPPPGPRSRKVERDKNGQIERITEEGDE